MDSSSGGKPANASFSIRYNVNNEELEDVFPACDDDPPTPHTDPSPSHTPTAHSESASPKRLDKSGSIIDKYFKSIRQDKTPLDDKPWDTVKEKIPEEKSAAQKDANSSPMKDYLNRLGKKGKEQDLSVPVDGKDGPNETWKIFQDFKVKIAQAVEDMKSSRGNDEKEKSVPRDSSVSDSEENSAVRDVDQHSVGDTDNQVSSLHSSIHNLSELTQPMTAKVDVALPDKTKTVSESSDDTQKNFQLEDTVPNDDDSLLDVESGVEALEEANILDTLDNFTYLFGTEATRPDTTTEPNYISADYLQSPLMQTSSQKSIQISGDKKYFFTFSFTLFTVAVFLSNILFPSMHAWNGFLMGMWTLNFMRIAHEWVMDWICDESDLENYNYFKRKRSQTYTKVAYTIPPIKEHRPIKKYEGWINHYRFPEYDPNTYRINKTTTAFMKLEDNHLRISYTRTKISRKATWDEKMDKVKFYQHRLYNLAGARIILLPKGLVSKRMWSKKYPICVILSEKEKIQVLEKEPAHEKKDGSPEKKMNEKKEQETDTADNISLSDSSKHKRKFVWRKKDRESPVDPIAKAGLRQRISRRIHRDKKTEDASTSTDPVKIMLPKEKCEDDGVAVDSTPKTKEETGLEEDMDSEQMREYLRIKELLDEAEELEGNETRESADIPTEWSLHTKDSHEVQHHLYIFPRTGRDKHEWYRRILAAIKQADDEVSNSELHESEANVFRVADKDAVAFSRLPGSTYNVNPEPITVSWTEETLKAMDMAAHERDFWPYMYKIIQQSRLSGSADSQVLSDSPSVGGRVTEPDVVPGGVTGTTEGNLPVEVGWLNALLGRIAYDAMRNPAVVARVQRRIQRKLNTLKLPSVMGALIATELSLGSVTPLVEVMAGPACDERGVWLDADVRYDGGAYITLNTKINLMKLNEKKLEEQLERQMEHNVEQDTDLMRDLLLDCTPPTAQTTSGLTKNKSAIYDSEVDDSAESSSDEESNSTVAFVSSDDRQPVPDVSTLTKQSSDSSGSGAKKFLRMVDKITTSRYFQQISDYKYVKKAMEGLSNTDIKLNLELKGLEGRLAINLPPPPHDRVWIGFRSNPRIWLKAKPALGTRAVRITHITNWIEQKLCKEFEKVLVLPNMEDITIDLLTPTPVEFE